IPIAPSLYSLSNKMDNSLLAVRDINHKYIVVEKGCDLAIKGPDKRTLLHIAASYNDADIVKFLAKKEDLKKKTEEQM
ncbi:MAG: ankyrin repeat domain-containing protein, partial [Dorea sp.]|nr:ankyrin repeat domain-containing protein [Dorea sp.]